MARPIPRTLLDKAGKGDRGPVVSDTESFTFASLQLVYTAKRVSVALKGKFLGGVEATIGTLDSLTTRSGRMLAFKDWTVGIEEIWAEVTAIDGGEVSLYFCGKE